MEFCVLDESTTGYGTAGYALFIAVYAGLEASFFILLHLLLMFLYSSLTPVSRFCFLNHLCLDTSHSSSPIDDVGWSSLRSTHWHHHSFYQWNCKLFLPKNTKYLMSSSETFPCSYIFFWLSYFGFSLCRWLLVLLS